MSKKWEISIRKSMILIFSTNYLIQLCIGQSEESNENLIGGLKITQSQSKTTQEIFFEKKNWNWHIFPQSFVNDRIFDKIWQKIEIPGNNRFFCQKLVFFKKTLSFETYPSMDVSFAVNSPERIFNSWQKCRHSIRRSSTFRFLTVTKL